MADNRIYLRCKGCGETLFLGKCIYSGFYWRDYYNGEKGTLEEQLNNFYDEHAYCTKPKAKPPYEFDEKLWPIPEGYEECVGAFDIVYESGWGVGLNVEENKET